MIKPSKTLFVRNRRPNRVVFSYAGARYTLERRGAREDSVSLPAEAANDPLVGRWLKQGILEKINRESFMRLASRTVDTRTSEFLKRHPMRTPGSPGELALSPADADTTRSLTQVTDGNVHKSASPNLEWAGELMSTEEELDEFLPDQEEGRNYPSKHRDDDSERRQMGY